MVLISEPEKSIEDTIDNYEPGMVLFAYDSSTHGEETEPYEYEAHGSHTKFQVSLGYIVTLYLSEKHKTLGM